ncbi:MAG: FMN-binding negative transcriptional regulator [Chitinophagales bacterium]
MCWLFSGAHAYISPKLYEKTKRSLRGIIFSVRTYGRNQLLNTDEQKLDVLHKQMQFLEADYIEQFNSLDKKYIAEGLLKGIVAFEIIVSELQSKKSQSEQK